MLTHGWAAGAWYPRKASAGKGPQAKDPLLVTAALERLERGLVQGRGLGAAPQTAQGVEAGGTKLGPRVAPGLAPQDREPLARGGQRLIQPSGPEEGHGFQRECVGLRTIATYPLQLGDALGQFLQPPELEERPGLQGYNVRASLPGEPQVVLGRLQHGGPVPDIASHQRPHVPGLLEIRVPRQHPAQDLRRLLVPVEVIQEVGPRREGLEVVRVLPDQRIDDLDGKGVVTVVVDVEGEVSPDGPRVLAGLHVLEQVLEASNDAAEDTREVAHLVAPRVTAQPLARDANPGVGLDPALELREARSVLLPQVGDRGLLDPGARRALRIGLLLLLAVVPPAPAAHSEHPVLVVGDLVDERAQEP